MKWLKDQTMESFSSLSFRDPRSPSDKIGRVPEVTWVFWVIKCLCTALGETMADLMNNLFGANHTSQGKALAVFGCMLVVFLTIQFLLRRYFAPVYWATVLLISICGTLITDIMVDQDHVQHPITTGVFSALLALNFAVWFYFEGTLSIHEIYTARREMFYWLAVLFSFVLGTSTGDQISEDDGLGYWRVLLITVGIILGDYAIYIILKKIMKEKLPPWVVIVVFWIAYVTTRPTGASIGDLLAAPRGNTYDPAYCYPLGTNITDSLCQSGDVFCITKYNSTIDCNTYNTCSYSTCPKGYYKNPCNPGEPTCYTPPPCKSCWGLDGLKQTNIAFGVAVFVLVAYLVVSRVDLIKRDEQDKNKQMKDEDKNEIQIVPTNSTNN